MLKKIQKMEKSAEKHLASLKKSAADDKKVLELYFKCRYGNSDDDQIACIR